MKNITFDGKKKKRHNPARSTEGKAASEVGDSMCGKQGQKGGDAIQGSLTLTFEEPWDDHPSEHVGVFHHERLSGLSPASQITRLVGVASADHLESLAQKYGLLLVLRDAPAGLRAHGVVAACGHAVRVVRSPRAGRVFCLALAHCCWHVKRWYLLSSERVSKIVFLPQSFRIVQACFTYVLDPVVYWYKGRR